MRFEDLPPGPVMYRGDGTLADGTRPEDWDLMKVRIVIAHNGWVARHEVEEEDA